MNVVMFFVQVPAGSNREYDVDGVSHARFRTSYRIASYRAEPRWNLAGMTVGLETRFQGQQ